MGVDINQAGNRIAQLLSQPEQPSDSAEAEATTESVLDNVEVEEKAETEEVEAQPEPDPETVEESESEETPEGDTESEEQTYTVKVGGEEREVTLDDLRKGYMMESDYRKKTSEVARDREEVNNKLNDLVQKISEADAMLQFEAEDLDSPENQELKELDPQAFYEKREIIEAKQKKYKKIQESLVEEATSRQQELLKREKELVFQAIPEWLDTEAMKKDALAINGLLSNLNFSQQEIDSLNDHRYYVILRKAAMYDQIKSAKPDEKKVKTVPKAVKPGTTSTPEKRQSDKISKIRNQVKKTGLQRDAAEAIKALMK